VGRRASSSSKRQEESQFNTPKIMPKNSNQQDKRAKEHTKKMNLYISEDFPLKFETLQPLISFLSHGNEILQNLSNVLNQSTVETLMR
jgi:hypothetical protein